MNIDAVDVEIRDASRIQQHFDAIVGAFEQIIESGEAVAAVPSSDWARHYAIVLVKNPWHRRCN